MVRDLLDLVQVVERCPQILVKGLVNMALFMRRSINFAYGYYLVAHPRDILSQGQAKKSIVLIFNECKGLSL